MFKFFKKENKSITTTKAYYQNIGKPVWTDRNYLHLAEESYVKNVIANRCISMISQSASAIKLELRNKTTGEIIKKHRILDLLQKPNPIMDQNNFFETIYAHKLISGNVYIQAIFSKNSDDKEPQELFILRPDRVTILAGNTDVPIAYKYKFNNSEQIFKINQITGKVTFYI